MFFFPSKNEIEQSEQTHTHTDVIKQENVHAHGQINQHPLLSLPKQVEKNGEIFPKSTFCVNPGYIFAP